MKLQIIVIHYNELLGYVERFLDSIKVQDFINKDDFEVLIINDGNKVPVTDQLLSQYNFSIKYFEKDWGGLSSARQFGQDKATADYIMFCDCDDMFLRIDALYKILKNINENKTDLILSSRLQNIQNKLISTSAMQQITTHEVHGKVYRRQFLIDHNITWNLDIKLWHEDFYFNNLVLCENPSVSYISDQIYLWQNRPNSVSSLKDKESTEKDKRLFLLVDRYLVLLNALKTRKNKEFFTRKIIYLMLLIYDIYMTNKALFEQIKQYVSELINNYYLDILDIKQSQVVSAMKTLDINFVLKYNFVDQTFSSWWSSQDQRLDKFLENK